MLPEDLTRRYELSEVLGRGGMAEVWRARDRRLDRQVAIKVLHDTVDDSERDRFTTEARTLAGLSHPGLVVVLDAGTTEHRPYLIMELVEGITLEAALEDGALAPVDVQAVGLQLAQALAYAHEQGVVHRDVKPANVLLGPEGVVKLADFGVAKLLGDVARHTRTGTTIGTAAYLSPEQVQGLPVDPASDVYSLGLVLLEAATGERAYPGTPTEAAVARLHRPPAVPQHLPREWQALLAEMLAMDPEGRPTAVSVASVLARRPSARPMVDPTAAPDQESATVTKVVETVPPAPPAGASVAPDAGATSGAGATAAIDRWGDSVAASVSGAWRRVRSAPRHQHEIALATAMIVLFLVVIAVLGQQ